MFPMGRRRRRCCCRKRSRLRHAVQMRIMGNRYPIRMNWRQTGTTGPIWKQTRGSMPLMNPKPALIQAAIENRDRLFYADYLPHMSSKSHLCKHRPTQVNYPSVGGITIRNQGRAHHGKHKTEAKRSPVASQQSRN